MEPALQYIDAASGRIIETAVLPDKQASIRHLDVTTEGEIVVGLQLQCELPSDIPLVAFHRLGQEIRYVEAEDHVWHRFQGYVGSVSCNKSSVVVTSPRGGCFGIISLTDKALTESHSMKDVCAAARRGQGWLLGTGLGYVLDFQSTSDYATIGLKEVAWDNHWALIYD